MHGKSVSPLIRVRKPALRVWYQRLSSHVAGVSTLLRKSTAGTSAPSGPGTSWVTSTIYSHAPMPSKGGHVQLWMKPELKDDDDAYKRTTHDHLKTMGTVLAAFDNEPQHINDYAVKFPDAVPVHLATDHSGRDVKLNERCVSIPHFAY